MLVIVLKRGGKWTAVVEKQFNGVKVGRKAHLVDFYLQSSDAFIKK